ncbi:MAG: hypothetical protein LBJ25_04180, partial [Candidatus Margulisbacteria bacterium]|nr:hypothetical protein [Candidatus Margulisiibacteriota bacterium]
MDKFQGSEETKIPEHALRERRSAAQDSRYADVLLTLENGQLCKVSEIAGLPDDTAERREIKDLALKALQKQIDNDWKAYAVFSAQRNGLNIDPASPEEIAAQKTIRDVQANPARPNSTIIYAALGTKFSDSDFIKYGNVLSLGANLNLIEALQKAGIDDETIIRIGLNIDAVARISGSSYIDMSKDMDKIIDFARKFGHTPLLDPAVLRELNALSITDKQVLEYAMYELLDRERNVFFSTQEAENKIKEIGAELKYRQLANLRGGDGVESCSNSDIKSLYRNFALGESGLDNPELLLHQLANDGASWAAIARTLCNLDKIKTCLGGQPLSAEIIRSFALWESRSIDNSIKSALAIVDEMITIQNQDLDAAVRDHLYNGRQTRLNTQIGQYSQQLKPSPWEAAAETSVWLENKEYRNINGVCYSLVSGVMVELNGLKKTETGYTYGGIKYDFQPVDGRRELIPLDWLKAEASSFNFGKTECRIIKDEIFYLKGSKMVKMPEDRIRLNEGDFEVATMIGGKFEYIKHEKIGKDLFPVWFGQGIDQQAEHLKIGKNILEQMLASDIIPNCANEKSLTDWFERNEFLVRLYALSDPSSWPSIGEHEFALSELRSILPENLNWLSGLATIPGKELLFLLDGSIDNILNMWSHLTNAEDDKVLFEFLAKNQTELYQEYKNSAAISYSEFLTDKVLFNNQEIVGNSSATDSSQGANAADGLQNIWQTKTHLREFFLNGEHYRVYDDGSALKRNIETGVFSEAQRVKLSEDGRCSIDGQDYIFTFRSVPVSVALLDRILCENSAEHGLGYKANEANTGFKDFLQRYIADYLDVNSYENFSNEEYTDLAERINNLVKNSKDNIRIEYAKLTGITASGLNVNEFYNRLQGSWSIFGIASIDINKFSSIAAKVSPQDLLLLLPKLEKLKQLGFETPAQLAELSEKGAVLLASPNFDAIADLLIERAAPLKPTGAEISAVIDILSNTHIKKFDFTSVFLSPRPDDNFGSNYELGISILPNFQNTRSALAQSLMARDERDLQDVKDSIDLIMNFLYVLESKFETLADDPDTAKEREVFLARRYVLSQRTAADPEHKNVVDADVGALVDWFGLSTNNPLYNCGIEGREEQIAFVEALLASAGTKKLNLEELLSFLVNLENVKNVCQEHGDVEKMKTKMLEFFQQTSLSGLKAGGNLYSEDILSRMADRGFQWGAEELKVFKSLVIDGSGRLLPEREIMLIIDELDTFSGRPELLRDITETFSVLTRRGDNNDDSKNFTKFFDSFLPLVKQVNETAVLKNILRFRRENAVTFEDITNAFKNDPSLDLYPLTDPNVDILETAFARAVIRAAAERLTSGQLYNKANNIKSTRIELLDSCDEDKKVRIDEALKLIDEKLSMAKEKVSADMKNIRTVIFRLLTEELGIKEDEAEWVLLDKICKIYSLDEKNEPREKIRRQLAKDLGKSLFDAAQAAEVDKVLQALEIEYSTLYWGHSDVRILNNNSNNYQWLDALYAYYMNSKSNQALMEIIRA